jgi:hypothetical protein
MLFWFSIVMKVILIVLVFDILLEQCDQIFWKDFLVSDFANHFAFILVSSYDSLSPTNLLRQKLNY